MSSIRIRPRIREFSNYSETELIERYKEIIESGNYPFTAKFVDSHLFVKCKSGQINVWSPELTLDVVENPMKGDEHANHNEPTLIRGYISPNPSVWVFFIFSYVGFGLLLLGFFVYGTSQMMLDQPTEIMWYALGSLMMIVIVFIASQIGQRLGEDQTNKLLDFVSEGLSNNK
jgi:hypothetical protein